MFLRACIDLDRAYAQGDAEKYIKIYKAAPKSYKEVKLHACRALLMQGKYDEAIEGLMKYTPKNKREEILRRFTIGEAHLRKGSKRRGENIPRICHKQRQDAERKVHGRGAVQRAVGLRVLLEGDSYKGFIPMAAAKR